MLAMGKVGQSYSRPTGAQQRRQVSIELEETDDEDAQLVGSQSLMETAESGLFFLSRSAAGGVTVMGESLSPTAHFWGTRETRFWAV